MSAGERIRTGIVAFRNPGFKNYWIALLCTGFAVQIQTVAVGWQVYDLTRDPLDLGLIGLSPVRTRAFFGSCHRYGR